MASRPTKIFEMTVSPAERRNWGYWDGRAAREAGRWPEWCRPSADFRNAHYDKQYGTGFHAGWYGEPHPSVRARLS